MTGQPTPDRDTLAAVLAEFITWPHDSPSRAADALLAALEGCAIIDGAPRRLYALEHDRNVTCYTTAADAINATWPYDGDPPEMDTPLAGGVGG